MVRKCSALSSVRDCKIQSPQFQGRQQDDGCPKSTLASAFVHLERRSDSRFLAGWGKKASNAKDESVVRDELKQRLLNICAASRQGIDGTGPATQEEFDGLYKDREREIDGLVEEIDG
jgi:hypothetical protein